MKKTYYYNDIVKINFTISIDKMVKVWYIDGRKGNGGRNMKKIILKTCSFILLMITLLSFCFMGGCASKGSILNLEKAYEQGFISKDELQQIADYNNRVKKNPYTVDDIKKRTKKGICKTYKQFLIAKEDFVDDDIEDVHIKKFFGKYGNAFVVEVDLGSYSLPMESSWIIDGILIRIWEQKVGGIVVFIEQ